MNKHSTKERNEYFNSLNMRQLLDILEVIIRHYHYCPCDCHCFDGIPYKNFSIGEIKDLIIERYEDRD